MPRGKKREGAVLVTSDQSFYSVCRCKEREHHAQGCTATVQPSATEPQTWWHSFCDGDRPKGQQFLGALVMDVDADEINAIRERVDFQQMVNMVPLSHDINVYGMAASIAKAHRLGVNPGGEVQSARIDGNPEATVYPRAVLMSRAQIEALEPPTAATD